MQRQWLSVVLVVVWAAVAGAQVDLDYLGPLIAHDFEDQAPGGVTMDVSGLSPALDATLVGGAAVVWDADRQSYVLDTGARNSGAGARAPIDPRLSVPGHLAPWTFSCWVRPRNQDDPNYNPDDPQGVTELWRFVAGSDDGGGPRCFSAPSGYIFGSQMVCLGGLWDGWLPADIQRSCEWSPNCPAGWDGTGPWHHFLVTYDGFIERGYVDGVLLDEHFRVGQILVAWADSGIKNWALGIDANGQGTGHYLDDVAFFRGYAPPATVQGLYDGTYDLTANLPPLVGADAIPVQENAPVNMPACVLPLASVQALLDSNLIGWWHFEEGAGTTADLSPNPAADAQLLDDVSTTFEDRLLFADADWTMGNVATFPTPDDPNFFDPCDYILVGENTKWDWQELDNGFTVMAWVKLENKDYLNDPNDGDVLRRQGHAVVDPATGATDPCTPDLGIWLNIHNGGIRFRVQTVGVTEAESGFGEGCWGSMKPGSWAHIAAVYRPQHPVSYDPADPATWGAPAGNKLSVYLSGASINPQNEPGSCSNSGGFVRGPIVPMDGLPLTIGSPGKPFRGRIDNVRLYKTALTEPVIKCAMKRFCRPYLVPGDLVNNDCAVNEADLAALAAGWLTSYDLADFAAVSADWLGTELFFPYY